MVSLYDKYGIDDLYDFYAYCREEKIDIKDRWYSFNNDDFSDEYYGDEESNIFIRLELLTDDILEYINEIPEKYNNTTWFICGSNTHYIDIKLLMSKLIHCKNIFIATDEAKFATNLPPNLEFYGENNYSFDHYIDFPDTLKDFQQINYDYDYSRLDIPYNIPSQLDYIELIVKNLNKTFYNIKSVKKLNIRLKTLGLNNILWPNTLQKLELRIDNECDKSFGILPYGLINFDIFVQTYNYPIEFPPTLTYLSLLISHKYKYADTLNSLPDSIEYLSLWYDSCPNIVKLPDACKTFRYSGCPKDILDELKVKYPNVNIL